ncbi:MAG: hypothetical protein ABFD89_21960 [Bryobacteraceae bacterium]
MAITLIDPVQLGAGLWSLSWTSTVGAPYRVYRDGVLVSTQEATEFLVSVDDGDSPLIEVLDADTVNPTDAHPPNLILGWQRDADAVQYLIEEYSGGAWVARDRIVPVSGSEWLTYSTGTLADVTSHQWRIKPIDAAGNSGTVLAFTVLMVRYPDPPAVTFTYASGTAKITIAAEA